ncbi:MULTISPECIES: 3'-5' exonuclease [Deinococcus]|uniref:Exonuclease domain-containing protein n=1 Tax=Deinococcus rufus TaxID=2136097 RepID=A0ABV7ZAT7_9DEIO|nr:3'-5' exonuclease [Deinococcus sp. AB2017081]WQE95632.1 3'-5' exonuclease [Deinococcus sp. AB2017081]
MLNIIDIEATCWDGPPPAGQTNEIIEIGVCVLDMQSLERVERRSVLVRPERSEVSAFCTELTGLTPAEVVGGISFREACEELRRTFHTDSRPWASWGDYDRKQFQLQCAASGVPYPFSSRHTNAKKVYTEAHGLRKRPGMAQALAAAGLPLEGRHHRGVDDAWNIAALVAGLIREEQWTP